VVAADRRDPESSLAARLRQIDKSQEASALARAARFLYFLPPAKERPRMTWLARLLLCSAAFVAAVVLILAASHPHRGTGPQSSPARGAGAHLPGDSSDSSASDGNDKCSHWEASSLNERLPAEPQNRRVRLIRGKRFGLLEDLYYLASLVRLQLAGALADWSRSAGFLVLGIVVLVMPLPGSAYGQMGSRLLPRRADESPGGNVLRLISVPPRANAIFSPPSPDSDVRYAPDGNGWIVIAGPLEYPRVPAVDCDDPGSLFYSWRPNMAGIEVPDEWDFYNLINTDRPDFTDATFSVGRGVTILETGYTYRRATDPASQTEQSRRSLPEALIRYGLTDEFEVRLKWNGYVMSDLRDFSTGLRTQLFGTDDLVASIKYEVWQQNGALPMLTFLTGSTLPSGTNGISSNQMQPFANFVAGWGLRRWLYLKMSTGIDWQKTSVSTLFGGGSEPVAPLVVFLRDNINVYHFSSSLLYQALPRVGGFAEFFGFAQIGGADNRPAIYFDTGLFLYATTNVQFDVRYGLRLSERVNELFTGAGFSVRY
jgi:hypothetical protein